MEEAFAGVPVVLFGSADEADVHWQAQGADGCVQKPFNVRVLPDMVRGHLAARAP